MCASRAAGVKVPAPLSLSLDAVLACCSMIVRDCRRRPPKHVTQREEQRQREGAGAGKGAGAEAGASGEAGGKEREAVTMRADSVKDRSLGA